MNKKNQPVEDLFQLGVKALIRNKQGQILLLEANTKNWAMNKTTHWDLPGGRIKQDSTTEETLHREIKEETGLAGVENIQLFASALSHFRIPLGKGSVGLILFIYLCEIADQPIKLSDEHISFGWFEPKEAAKLLEIKFPKDFTDKVKAL